MCPVTASHNVQILMRVEAHCAWLQTCRTLSSGDGRHDAESVLDSTGFRQLLNHIYKARELHCMQDKSLTLTSTEVPGSYIVCPRFLGIFGEC